MFNHIYHDGLFEDGKLIFDHKQIKNYSLDSLIAQDIKWNRYLVRPPVGVDDDEMEEDDEFSKVLKEEKEKKQIEREAKYRKQ